MFFFKPLKQEGQQSPQKCFHFLTVEDIKKSGENGKTLGRRLQRADKAFFLIDLHTYDTPQYFPAYDIITTQAHSCVSFKLILRRSNNCVF
jgi:hypothetical protein